MKIGINLIGESGLNSGSGRITKKIIEILQRIDNENEYFVYYHKDYDTSIFNLKSSNFHYIKVPTNRNVMIRRIVEQFILPFYLIKNRVEVIFSSNNIGIIAAGNKNIIMIHDLAHWKKDSPQSKFIHKVFLRTLQYLSTKLAKKIITISEFSKQDIINTLKIAPNKVFVNYNGIDFDKFQVITKDKISETLNKYNIQGNYIFGFSSLLPHKNYRRLFEAFKNAELPIKLIFGGKRTAEAESLISYINEIKMQDKIIYIEYPSDEELVALLSGCLFYTLVSTFEGAGTTPLEAMSCNKAVLVGDIPAIKEYLGDKAVYVDPFDIQSISIGLKKLYEDSALREKLSMNGREHAKMFDFQKNVENLLQIILTEQ